MQNFLTPRQDARKAGLSRYIGKPCIHGHGNIRATVSSDCVVCRGHYKNIAAKKKRHERGLKQPGRKRLYPIFVGPPKPKRKLFKPETNVEKWIARSKYNNKKTRDRRELSIDYYKSLIVTHCPLLGLELSYDKYDGLIVPQNYATLDRIDPKKGYVEGNVQILSYRANTLKNSATLEELKMMVKNWTIF